MLRATARVLHALHVLNNASGLDDASMATTTSTLSDLTRTPTPPSNRSNYLTASEGTSGTATEPSSPAGEPCDDSGRHKAAYRAATDLPRELKARCHIHLEEQYCELQPPVLPGTLL